jgi:hypothetical protein
MVYSQRLNRLKSAAKREESAYHSSGRGKLNTDQRAGRMPRAGKLYGGDERPVAPERDQRLPHYSRFAASLDYENSIEYRGFPIRRSLGALN